MPFRTEFDADTARSVVLRGLLGVVLGALPATAYIFWQSQSVNGDPLLPVLLQTGCLCGVIVGVGSGAAARLVAVIRSRGTGPGRVGRVSDREAVEALVPAGPVSVGQTPAGQVTAHRVRVSDHPSGRRGNEPNLPAQGTIAQAGSSELA
jgi:hypothetical protein